MAVKTKLSNEDLSRIAQRYDLPFRSAFEIEEGSENSNFIVRDASGKQYILTIFEDRIDLEGVHYCINLQNHVAENGFVAPKCYLTTDGRFVDEIRGKPFGVFQFLNGRPIAYQDLSNRNIFDIGGKIANFHVISQKFQQLKSSLFGVDFVADTYDFLYEKSAEYGDMCDKISKGFDILEGFEPSNMRIGAVHNDLFADNIFFDGKDIAFIDFYFACTDYLISDLAIAIIALCMNDDGIFLSERVTHLLNGYRSVLKIEENEKKSLKYFIIIAILRFLCTRTLNYIGNIKTRPYQGMLNRLQFVLDNISYFDSL